MWLDTNIVYDKIYQAHTVQSNIILMLIKTLLFQKKNIEWQICTD